MNSDPKPLAAPLSQPKCGRCNHDKDHHHNGLGMCMRQGGFICSCGRYRKPDAEPLVPENPNSDKHHIAAKAVAEVAAPLPEPTEHTICTLHDKFDCVECEGITKGLAYIAAKMSSLSTSLGTCADFPNTPHRKGTCENCDMWSPLPEIASPKCRPWKEVRTEFLRKPAEAIEYLRAALDDSPEAYEKAARNFIEANQETSPFPVPLGEPAQTDRDELERRLNADCVHWDWSGPGEQDELMDVIEGFIKDAALATKAVPLQRYRMYCSGCKLEWETDAKYEACPRGCTGVLVAFNLIEAVPIACAGCSSEFTEDQHRFCEECLARHHREIVGDKKAVPIGEGEDGWREIVLSELEGTSFTPEFVNDALDCAGHSVISDSVMLGIAKRIAKRLLQALQRERDAKESLEDMRELDKSKLPCGHHHGFGFTDDGGKTGYCTLCELSRLRSQEEPR